MSKILVIEDDINIRTNIKEFLEENDFQVETACNGSNGITKAIKLKPDLIISDIMMPDGDGYEVITQLGKNPETALIPFIFLTSKTQISEIREGMLFGADDYITKPFDFNDLLKAVNLRIEKRDKLLKQYEENKHKGEMKADETIFINSANHPVPVKIKEICYIEALEKYSYVWLVDETKLFSNKMLKEWEEILPKKLFLRVHRSTIVNIERIEKLIKGQSNTYKVVLKNGNKELVISQRFSVKLKQILHKA